MTTKTDTWIFAGLVAAVVGALALRRLSDKGPKKSDESPALPAYDGTKDLDGHVYYDVLVDNLAIRSLPSSDSAVVGALKQGMIVTSTGYTVGGLLNLTKKYVEIYVPPQEKTIGWVAAAGLTYHNRS